MRGYPDKTLKRLASAEEASILALQVLEFLSADADRIGDLLAITGINPQDLAQGATDPAFLAGILDYLLSNEPLLLEWANMAALPPEVAVQARRYLPGGHDAA